MENDKVVELAREAIMVALLLGAPLLLVGMIVGLLIGLLQALTQIQDQTVSFVPKVVAMVVAMAFALPWMLELLSTYSEDLINEIPYVVSGER